MRMHIENFKAKFLEPNKAVFLESPGGVLQLKIDNNFYQKVRLFHLFPLYSKSNYISVCTVHKDELKEIGIIKDIAEFPEEQQKLIHKKLEQRYFILEIKKIISLKEMGDNLYWKVETNHGEVDFILHDPYDNIRIIENKKMLLIDIYQYRYEIKDFNIIDKKTRDILSRHIYL